VHIKRLAAAGVLAALIGSTSLSAVTAEAAGTTTQSASCKDGGGATWKVRSVWGSQTVTSAGVAVVKNDVTEFTTSAKAATTVDYTVKVYSGSGSLVGTLVEKDKAFSFKKGTRYLQRNPKNPPVGAGRAKIVVSVGDGNDGRSNCSVTFLQPKVAVKPASATSTAMPVGDLPGWRQNFVDDFSADAPLGSWSEVYGNRWRAYPEPWRDTSKRGIYSPQRVLSASNGMLDMYIHSEKGQPYVAAPEPKINGAGQRGQTYGRYSVRFRVTNPMPGYKTAWLLWPDSNKSAEGEIDFPEGNLSAGSTMNAFAHDVHGNHAHNAFAKDSRKTYDEWHVATMEWLPSGVTYWLDGAKLGTAPKHGTPRTAMHWVLQTETALEGRAPASHVSGHVQVDWVAVWSKA